MMTNTATVIELEQVYQHVGGHCALNDLSLRVDADETVLLIGPNGAGKTLLVRLLLGLDQPSAGRVRLFGDSLEVLDDRGMRRLRNLVGAVLQRGSLIDELSVVENLTLPLRGGRMGRADIARAARLAVTLFRLDGLENKRPRTLSIGQRRLVELAQAMIRRPRLLIWDGLGDGLDRATVRELIALLRQQSADGLTLLATDHGTLDAVADDVRLLVLDRGRLCFDGSRAELLDQAETDLTLGWIVRGYP
jgi:ABC-type multidrug transport system ATPase subunit